ncbi:MAG TPA: hypothetical protein VK209_07975 [Candidatus Sulfotelmatobacter sp.]|nr:hypothetical protein [Candidatus Sulfotelmatobacter sp.]
MAEKKEGDETNPKKQSSDPETGPLVTSDASPFMEHEPVEVTIPPAGVFTPNLPTYQSPQNIFSDSDEKIGGTITALDNLQKTLQAVETNAFSFIESNIDKKLTENIKPIQIQLESTQRQVGETIESLKRLGGFIEENRNYFINLISVEGKISGFESQISSIQQRLEKLEDDKNINWNKTTTVISLSVAVLSMCCGGLAVLAAIIQFLTK